METCDFIVPLENGSWAEICGRAAVARTITRPSPLTTDGRVRYCDGHLKIARAWGVETEPWPPPKH